MISLAFSNAQGQPRQLRLHQPEGLPKAVLLIVHGMAEHYARYYPLAEYLVSQGIAVAGYDQSGHGPETPEGQRGHFGDDAGWQGMVDDVGTALALLKARLPDTPLFIMGHSMGSFVVREYLLQSAGQGLSGAVLSGTGWQPKPLCVLGLSVARLVCLLGGQRKPSKLLHHMAFSANNRAFEPARTPCDWLSRDEEQVDLYVADPYCGFKLTGGAYCDFFGGLKELTDTTRLKGLPATLPLLLISGDKDPVGGNGAGVNTVARLYQQAGLQQVQVKLYPDGRHELFNDINREEVMADLSAWLLHQPLQGGK